MRSGQINSVTYPHAMPARGSAQRDTIMSRLQIATDLVEVGRDFCSSRSNGLYDHNSDQSANETIFDGCRAAFIAQEFDKELLHANHSQMGKLNYPKLSKRDSLWPSRLKTASTRIAFVMESKTRLSLCGMQRPSVPSCAAVCIIGRFFAEIGAQDDAKSNGTATPARTGDL